MKLLLDIGNTSTHAALATARRIRRHAEFHTDGWASPRAAKWIRTFAKDVSIKGVMICSVVPKATGHAKKHFREMALPAMEFTYLNCGIAIDYPEPATIGPDRLANARAGMAEFGAPVVVVDFGTALTFDIVDRTGSYAGGIIAPGLAAMTDYLHEKTALLPRIKLRDENTAIGKNTEQAMRIGAVHGYRGLVQSLIAEVKGSLKTRRLPVVATGGQARLIARRVPEISAVRPLLTLEGLRLASGDGN